ncbi:hypothetical protein [Pseudazoarcus pumilus]|uniref:Uncharacterized protein n=1 Tax=Pseudazoarcus pumilus TaxID=2067960 RepID=A0A2I6SAG4_9RHOO|nr:hypothetical protein [Pseudazoarcus pumilus]AUN96258.1 hypothetical protein C0099_15705 [Pseudazoarcus pumilus]
MRRVIVAFDGGTQRSFEIGAQEVAIPDAEEARAWLLEAFDALDCEPTNPMGKLLAVDLILGVARAAGAAGFDADAPWAQRYANAVAALREGEVIVVDVEAFTVARDG